MARRSLTGLDILGYGFLVGGLFDIASALILPRYVRLLAQDAYFLFIFVAIWRSSNRYTGPRHWARLAQVSVIVGVLMMVAHGFAVPKGTGSRTPEGTTEASEAELIKTLNGAADLQNKKLPVMIDNVTKWYRVSVEKKQMTYHYQIVGMTSSDVDPATFYRDMRPELVSQACVDPVMKSAFQDGVAVAYSYSGSDNILIADIVIIPSDCGY